MISEEQLLELKEEIRSLKASIENLLSEKRLHEIMNAVVSQQLRGIKLHVSEEIELLSDLIYKSQGSALEHIQQVEEPTNTWEDRSNWSEQTPPPDPDKGKLTLYAGLPVNGLFFASKVSAQFIARKTFYQIIYDHPKAETGLLDLVTDVDTLTTAFHVPDTYLTACELRGIGNLSYEKMKNRQPGRVQLEGPNWVIEQKIIIEFSE